MRTLFTVALILVISCSFSCSPADRRPAGTLERVGRTQVPSKGKVVVVHGIFDTGIGLPDLRDALIADGYECLMPSLKPVDGRKGLELMAKQLRQAIDETWGVASRFSIVAFSMGGLISRYYLQELDGATRCQGLYTVATPHRGTYTAYLYPGFGTRQMRPESEFLSKLQRGEQIYDALQIPTTSYWSLLDIVMIPLSSPQWHQADNVQIWAPVHPALLWNRTLHRDLLRRLKKERGRPAAPLIPSAAPPYPSE